MEKSTKDTLSNRLVQLRTEKGWTQSDLVEKMYLSQRTISHIEKGDCTLSNLIQLADLYEVSVDYLLGRSTERRFITLGLDPLTNDIIEQLKFGFFPLARPLTAAFHITELNYNLIVRFAL